MTAYKKNEEYLSMLREEDAFRNLPWEKAWPDFLVCSKKINEIMTYYHHLPRYKMRKMDKKLDKYHKRVDIYLGVWGDELIELYEKYKDSNELPPNPKDSQKDEDYELLEDVPIIEVEPKFKKETKNEENVVKDSGRYDLHLNDITLQDSRVNNNGGDTKPKQDSPSSDSGRPEGLPEETEKRTVKTVWIYEEPGTDVLEEYELDRESQTTGENIDSGEEIPEDPPEHVVPPASISLREAKVNAIIKWYEEKLDNWHLGDD